MNNLREHLKDRKCNTSLYPGIGIGLGVVYFPLYNFGRKRTGFLAYRPDGAKKMPNDERGKYYTYITKGEVGVLGLESFDFSETIYLVSGVFKATALHRLGKTALHVSSMSYKDLKPQLFINNRPVVAIGDNDEEGRQFARRYGGFTSPKDIDEMSDEDILEMLA